MVTLFRPLFLLQSYILSFRQLPISKVSSLRLKRLDRSCLEYKASHTAPRDKFSAPEVYRKRGLIGIFF